MFLLSARLVQPAFIDGQILSALNRNMGELLWDNDSNGVKVITARGIYFVPSSNVLCAQLIEENAEDAAPVPAETKKGRPRKGE